VVLADEVLLTVTVWLRPLTVPPDDEPLVRVQAKPVWPEVRVGLVRVARPLRARVSRVSPMLMASASALVPIEIVSQLAELHRLTLVALVLPIFMAAAESRVRAPTVVVKDEAALPVREIAPPVTVSPAPPVIRPLKVLSPAKVWVVVLTSPGKDASAVWK
jgi:hypothetical protein